MNSNAKRRSAERRSDVNDLEPCPECGKGKLRSVIVDQTFNIEGTPVVVHDIRMDRCDACGKRVIDGPEMKRAKRVARQVAANPKQASG